MEPCYELVEGDVSLKECKEEKKEIKEFTAHSYKKPFPVRSEIIYRMPLRSTLLPQPHLDQPIPPPDRTC